MEQHSRILVIDDDPQVATDVGRALDGLPYEVIGACTIADGLARLAEKPDLVVLDLMVPNGDEGFHFLWQLRHHAPPEQRSTPVIVLSSLHSRTLLRFYPERSQLGVDGPEEHLPVEHFLDKPCSPTVLRATICRLLTGD